MARSRRLLRISVLLTTTAAIIVGATGVASACGGLVASNGTINLLRTTTLAAYHRGVEHYVTSFEFAGEGQQVGSIVPLPGVPTKVVKGGDWTLQRLVLETQPPVLELAQDARVTAASAEVLLETEIDALDITVLRGGAMAVGTWARHHGFFLPPDAPEVLAFYAERSPIFLAARFDAQRAAEQGVQRGDGTPIHVVIPTPRPWVPLRILALGRQEAETVEADIFLLTDTEPTMLPQAVESDGSSDQRGLILETSERTSSSLMRDLRSDDRMGWLPDGAMWLTYLRVDQLAGKLTHDLSIDASGVGRPDPVAAGLARPLTVEATLERGGMPLLPWIAAATIAIVAVVTASALAMQRRAARRRSGRSE
jgi:Uncharacterized protein conserved in bacteria (DUF2330)